MGLAEHSDVPRLHGRRDTHRHVHPLGIAHRSPIAAGQILTEESVGAAQIVAGDLGSAAPAYLSEVSDAFISGFGVASLVVSFVAAGGALFAWKFLPARADVDAPEPGRTKAPIG